MSGSTSSDVAGGSSPTDRRVVLHVSRVVPEGHLAGSSMKRLGTASDGMLMRTLRLTGVLGVAGCLHTLGCCEDLPKQYWLGWRVIAAGSVGFALIVVDILLGARRFNRAWQNELGRASLVLAGSTISFGSGAM